MKKLDRQILKDTVNIAWPVISDAASYEIIIKDVNGTIICTLVFNELGQLKSISFAAPASRDNASEQLQQTGFMFTISGLESGQTYSYSITSKNSSG